MAGSNKTRPVDKNEPVHVTVVLQRRNQLQPTESFAFTDRETTRYQTREELGQIHGASPNDLALVEAFAHEFGLTVSGRNANQRTVCLSGTAENMQRAFETTLAYYDGPHGTYRGRTGTLTLPQELQTAVTAVLGLDTRPVAKPHVRMASSSATPTGGMTPLQVAQLYNFPTGMNGSGQCIGIIELGGGYKTTDLNTYFKNLGLKAPTVKAISVDGGMNKPGVDQNADGEVMLDIEVAGCIAPGATICVYFAPNTDQGFHDAIATAVHDTTNKPSVISISWGGPEDEWTQQASNAMLAACTDAAAVGVTVTAASGDNGATDGVTDKKFHVDLPACLPPVLGCGGTRLNASNGVISSETVWNELANNEGATGGGVSRIFAKPSYQNNANVPVQPETKFAGRGVPDISGNADPVTGYLCRVDGKNMVIGGTSAVAPLCAGLVALLNQHLGKTLGFLNPALYKIGSTACRDITSGNNGGYQAGTGWDPCTGFGSPNGTAMLKALTGTATAGAS